LTLKQADLPSRLSMCRHCLQSSSSRRLRPSAFLRFTPKYCFIL